jgi:hypothetical protein
LLQGTKGSQPPSALLRNFVAVEHAARHGRPKPDL